MREIFKILKNNCKFNFQYNFEFWKAAFIDGK